MIRSTAAIRGEPEPPKRSRTRSPDGKELVSIWVMSSTGFIVGWSGLRGDLGTSKTVVASVAAASEAALTARGVARAPRSRRQPGTRPSPRTMGPRPMRPRSGELLRLDSNQQPSD